MYLSELYKCAISGVNRCVRSPLNSLCFPYAVICTFSRIQSPEEHFPHRFSQYFCRGFYHKGYYVPCSRSRSLGYLRKSIKAATHVYFIPRSKIKSAFHISLSVKLKSISGILSLVNVCYQSWHCDLKFTSQKNYNLISCGFSFYYIF